MFFTWTLGRGFGIGAKQGNAGQKTDTGTALRGLRVMATVARVATVTGVVTGCGAGVLSEGITGLSSTAVALDAGQAYTFEAQVQGAAKLAWTISGTDCADAGCGALSSTTGGSVRYTAPATVSKTQSVVLTASLPGTQAPVSTATIALNPTLSLPGRDLPSTTQGTAYSADLLASGGMSPMTWSVVNGALPNGVSLDAKTGRVSGTAAAAGSYTFAVAVVDASAAKGTAQATYTLAVGPASSGLAIATRTLPGGTAGKPYSTQVQAMGGTQPYSFSVAGGTVPAGLTLSATGVLAGTPAATGASSVVLRAKDATGASVTATLPIAILPAPLALSSSTLPDAAVGASYSAALPIAGGTAPYTCSSTGGSLPAGLSLSGCMVSGTATAAGSGTVTIKVADRAAGVATGGLNLRAVTSPLSITTASLPAASLGLKYSATIGASGGSMPYRCAMTGGSLPAGLSLSGCTIGGRMTGASGGSFTIQVTDGSTPVKTAARLFSIYPGVQPLALVSTTLPNGTVGTSYGSSIVATGGVAPYACSIAGGSLPAGVVLNGCSVVGKPSAAGSGSVSVQVKDAQFPPALASRSMSWSVAPTGLTVTTKSLPDGLVGAAYTATLSATGGVAPYRCAVVNGTLPAGLTLNGCVVSGTPSRTGTGSVTLSVADAETPAQTASAPMAWSVTAPKLSLATTTLPTQGMGTAYSAALAITGGTAPYTCSMTGGALPAGVALSGCTVTGKTTQAGAGSATIRVVDAAAAPASVTGAVQWTVTSSLALTASALPQTTVGKWYTADLPIAGGKAPYRCYVRPGELPPGLALTGCTVVGMPVKASTGQVYVHVFDSVTASVSGDLKLAVVPAATSTTGSLSLATTTLPNGTAAVFYSSTIQATGGTAPYSCSLTGGAMPAGLSLNGCLVTGTPTGAASGSLGVRVTDASSPVQSVSGAVNLAIAPAVLTLATANMPAAVAGQTYAGSMAAVGGTAPYRYNLVSGALPAGLVLGADGAISGSPQTAGTANFTAEVTDAGSPRMTASHAFSITVGAAALAVSSATLAPATAGQAYSAQVGVSGGTFPYACSVVSGALPAGLRLNGCTIVGTPSASSGATVTVKATDAGAPVQTASGTLTLPVSGSPMTITTSSLTNATKGVAYSAAIDVTGGTGAVRCAVTGGALPAGLQMQGATCAISGTPASAGAASITVTATDATTPSPNTAVATLPLTVNGAALALSSAALPRPVLGQAYSQAISATGGQGPFSFAVSGGSLPRGLTLSPGGVLSGTPTSAGASSFMVTVTDSAAVAESATQMYAPLVVYPAGAGNGKLSGSYAFLVQGFDAAANGDLPYQTASVGSFLADGAGLITGGEMDSNHQAAAGTQATVHLLGTYEVGAQDRGLVTLTVINDDGSTGASSTYEIAAAAEVAADGSDTPAQVAAEGGEPMLNTGAPGMLLAQDKGAFAKALQGSYVFGMRGDTPCLKTCGNGVPGGPAAAVGQFSANGAGQITAGTSDSNLGAQNFAAEPLSGSYAAADGNGRTAVTLTTAGTPVGVYPGSYTAYVVDSNQVLLMSSDSHATHVLLSGTAQLQQQGSFADSAMNGAFVGAAESTVDPASLGLSLADVSSSGTATIFRGTGAGDGTCAVTNVDVAGGAKLTAAVQAAGTSGAGITALLGAGGTTGAVSCKVSAQGRGVLTAATPSAAVSTTLSGLGLSALASAPRVFYLSAAGRGYFLESGYAALGSLEPQTGSPFNNAMLQGTYDFGTGAASTGQSDSGSGLMQADGSGSLTLWADAGLDGSGQLAAAASQAAAYTVADATAGRITVNGVVLYMLTPDRLLRLDEGTSVDSPSLGAVQR